MAPARGRVVLAAVLALGALAALGKVAVDRARSSSEESLAERGAVGPGGVEKAGEGAAPTKADAPTDPSPPQASANGATPGPAGSPDAAAPTPPTDTATAAAAPPEPAPPPSAAPPPASDEPPPKLLSFQGLLTVTSPIDAEVVVQGQPVGRTNQRLLTRCGPRNVRLRQDGAWVSGGEHVRITCMEHTTVAIAPSR